MNPSRQIKVTKKEVKKFISYMESLGYSTKVEGDEYRKDFSFSIDGKTTVNHAATMCKGVGSWIMVRA